MNTNIPQQSFLFDCDGSKSNSQAENPEAPRVKPERSGEELKQKAHAVFEARRPAMLNEARRVILSMLLDGQPTVCADDVYTGLTVPEGVNSKFLGGVPGKMATAGILKHVGYTKSKRKERHAGDLKTWALADRAKAEQWLANNPAASESGVK